MNDNQQPTLPPWFTRPQPTTCRQQCLFRSRFADALVGLRISDDECARWHANGWLSFDGSTITEVNDFDDPYVWELTVVRDIVRAGLSDAQVNYLLDQLPKPLALDPDSLTFSFRYGWVDVSVPTDPDPEDVIEEHLGSWLDDCDEDRLRKLHARIGELLNTFEEDAQEGDK